jgi:hypothetical protein
MLPTQSIPAAPIATSTDGYISSVRVSCSSPSAIYIRVKRFWNFRDYDRQIAPAEYVHHTRPINQSIPRPELYQKPNELHCFRKPLQLQLLLACWFSGRNDYRDPSPHPTIDRWRDMQAFHSSGLQVGRNRFKMVWLAKSLRYAWQS